MRKKIYLCGPIFGMNDAEATNWRATVRDLWCGRGGAVLDPMIRDARGKEEDPKVVAEVVEQDKLDIANADGLIVYWFQPSVGTSMEILWAWMLRKPIALVNASGAPTISIWLRYHCTVFPDIESALTWLANPTNS